MALKSLVIAFTAAAALVLGQGAANADPTCPTDTHWSAQSQTCVADTHW